MPINKDDHENMITCKQVLMRPNEVNKNGRIYPATNDKGDDIMENKQNGKDNIMSNEALKNLKELAESVNNLIDRIGSNKNDANTKNAKEDNCYENSCECCNKHNHDDLTKESRDNDVDDMIKSFVSHLGNVLGCKATVVPITGSKSFTDFIGSICDKCDNREYCDSFGGDDDEDEDDILEEIADKQDDIIKYLEHLEEGIRIIMRGQNESNIDNNMIPAVIRKGKAVASKKRVKKLEEELAKAQRDISEQRAELHAVKEKLKKLMANQPNPLIGYEV